MRGLETTIHKKEAERDIYTRELVKIEKKIAKAEGADEATLEAELRMLEAEDRELEAQLRRLEAEEREVD